MPNLTRRSSSNRRRLQFISIVAIGFVIVWCIIIVHTHSSIGVIHQENHSNGDHAHVAHPVRILNPDKAAELAKLVIEGGDEDRNQRKQYHNQQRQQQPDKKIEERVVGGGGGALKSSSSSSGSSLMKANVKNDPYYGWSPDIITTTATDDYECKSIRKCFETEHSRCNAICRESEQQIGYNGDYIESNIPSVEENWIPNPYILHQMYLDGVDANGNKYPPILSKEYCEDINVFGKKNGDTNKQLFDSVPVKATTSNEEADLPTLFCGIYTMYEKHSTNVRAIRDTWGNMCNGFVAFSTKSDPRIPAYAIQHEGNEEYNNMWQKSRSIWKFIYDNYVEEFDYFILGGEDLFVLPTNLRRYLQSLNLNSDSDDLFAGRRFKGYGNNNYFNSGGAGYVLSRSTLRKLITEGYNHPKCNPHRHTAMEDVMIAECLRNVFNIGLTDTRDLLGRERFHPFAPGHHLTWKYPPEGAKRDWYSDYNQEWGLKLGKDCCAPDSVSFHYIKKPAMVRHLYSLLYLC